MSQYFLLHPQALRGTAASSVSIQTSTSTLINFILGTCSRQDDELSAIRIEPDRADCP